MDVRLHGNSKFHHKVNGGARRSSRSEKDDTLKYLSPEEQETLQFFEQTIDSLDDSLEEQENRRSGQIKPQENSHTPVCIVDGHSIPNPPPHQDIIDLVHSEPDRMPPKEAVFNPNNPDFQHMIPPPESHFEVKPRHESMALEYSRPTPNTPPDGQFAYHPPGSVPTPVLIAQKLAENQGGGTTNFHPSTFLRRLSLDTEKPLMENSDHSSRYGPPTSSKPSHLPPNISMMLGGKEHPKPSGSDENIYNRQELIHASPSVTPPFSPLEHHRQSTEQKVRKAPGRSISFKDPTPDKSRLEALSKLGLTRNRAIPNPAPVENTTTHNPPSEVTSLSFNHFGGKSIVVHPTAPSRNDPSTSPVSSEPKIPLPTLSNPPEANLYGGKTKVMNSASINRTDLPDILCSHIHQSPAASTRPEPVAAELNSYGGKSLTFNPSAGGNRSTVSSTRSVKGPPPTPAPRPARNSYHGPLSPPKPVQAERRKSNSMFRPQGITVQFSGRGPMNDSRREALRKLGLLKT
ncbi:hypothetical protein OJAV_G00221870 [Oryzias javanicus]|uniref:Proline and serine-rich protein 2 n=1 Tax=Oryzias javanicus TaxID=123683 RepID=A0A437C1A6_ORYJA|nr:hypothetical protein OJAV_G00221870 [Oryzias javanicus]